METSDALALAERRLTRIADTSSPVDAATIRLREGLRRRLLGEPGEEDPDRRLIAALNRAERLLDPPRYLLLEGVEIEADLGSGSSAVCELVADAGRGLHELFSRRELTWMLHLQRQGEVNAIAAGTRGRD